MNLTARLIHPSTLILIAANLVPLLGIAFWHWDAFLLLVLYWLETAIIGFWTIMSIAVAPRTTLGKSARQTSRLFLVPFFIVHSGIFMGVHFLFLWTLFSGNWAQRVHNPVEFFDVIVIGAGLWVPLVALFVSRGFSFLLMTAGAHILPAWLSLAPDGSQPSDDNPFSEKRLLGGFYARIIVMHLTILIGGFFAVALGTAGALMFLVALKIVIDLKLHLKNDFPETKPQTVTTA
jgi:hypothetical protein